MAQVQEVWNKLNQRERLTAGGALVVVLAWLIGLAARGFGVQSIGLLGAIAVLVVLYLKYAPAAKISWPAPVPLITLAISGIVALFAVINLIEWLGYLDILSPVAFIGLALYTVGALLMAWGSWQEYQVEKPAMPNLGGGTAASTATATPPATEPAAPVAPAPAADSDEAPPA